MTIAELKTLLDTTQLPVSYTATPVPTNLPCIAFYQTDVYNFGADGVVYWSRKRISVSLYSKHRDQTSEETIESALNNSGIYWDSKSVEYDDDQKLYSVTYDITI